MTNEARAAKAALLNARYAAQAKSAAGMARFTLILCGLIVAVQVAATFALLAF